VGTGWVVHEDVIVTNRHVASEFARKKDERFVFRQSMLGDMAARLDFREEYQETTPSEFRILEVLHIEEDAGPDVAFLRIDWGEEAGGTPRVPIALASEFAEQQWVAVIGYPAKDSRTRMSDEMDRIFGNIYDVKRLAPGQVMRNLAERGLLTHDSTTLGGNSGSAVLDMDSGEAIGLHFGGREESANYAVTAPVGTFAKFASPYGICDLAGNVADWTLDWYTTSHHAGLDGFRVARGGSWMAVPAACDAVTQATQFPLKESSIMGFRGVKGPVPTQ
jgi:endonuclease G